jgi:hypothetical protein
MKTTTKTVTVGATVAVVLDGVVAWTGTVAYLWGRWVGVREGSRVDEVLAELVVVQ